MAIGPLRIEGTAKAIALFALILVVSTGLCGITFSLSFNHGGDSISILLGIIELIGMLVGAVGLICSLILALFHAAVTYFRPQRDVEDGGLHLNDRSSDGDDHDR